MNPKSKTGPAPANTSKLVSSRLHEMIQSGELSLGERLPPERDLAKKLGISRPTLRAGIRSLAALGLLKSRQGSGTFVVEQKESPEFNVNQLQMLSALYNFTPDEMFEARIDLEVSVAGLAAERATGEQITLLAEEITGMFASLTEPEQFLFHDMKFHQTIGGASGNRILTAMINMVTQVLLEKRSKTVKQAKDLHQSAEMHRQIYRAIRDGNAAAARLAMREHLLATQQAQKLERLKEI
jgi:GntR family transcriptional regulator, transcriptional repressor for pyruvate dehydrogenase complex